jgi:hypothetical protein
MDLLRNIEATALKLRDNGTPPLTFEIDGTAPAIVPPMSVRCTPRRELTHRQQCR